MTPIPPHMPIADVAVFVGLLNADLNSTWSRTINGFRANPTEALFYEIVAVLQSQALDDSNTMERILGEDLVTAVLMLDLTNRHGQQQKKSHRDA